MQSTLTPAKEKYVYKSNLSTLAKQNPVYLKTFFLIKVFPTELEARPEFSEFKEWLHTFELYRGKKTGEESEDENRVVGYFKVNPLSPQTSAILIPFVFRVR